MVRNRRCHLTLSSLEISVKVLSCEITRQSIEFINEDLNSIFFKLLFPGLSVADRNLIDSPFKMSRASRTQHGTFKDYAEYEILVDLDRSCPFASHAVTTVTGSHKDTWQGACAVAPSGWSYIPRTKNSHPNAFISKSHRISKRAARSFRILGIVLFLFQGWILSCQWRGRSNFHIQVWVTRTRSSTVSGPSVASFLIRTRNS